MGLDAKARPYVTLEAVVTRADGTVEKLGVIATSKDKSLTGKFVDIIKNMAGGTR